MSNLKSWLLPLTDSISLHPFVSGLPFRQIISKETSLLQRKKMKRTRQKISWGTLGHPPSLFLSLSSCVLYFQFAHFLLCNVCLLSLSLWDNTQLSVSVTETNTKAISISSEMFVWRYQRLNPEKHTISSLRNS